MVEGGATSADFGDDFLGVGAQYRVVAGQAACLYSLMRPSQRCGCRKLCRGWSGGISVLVDESVTAGRLHDFEVSIWLVWWVG